MTRISTLIGLIACLLLPLDAAAFWLANDGQCFEDSPATTLWNFADADQTSSDAEPTEPDCSSVLDPSDSSFNACFELAEHPISTLPELIAQTQAERVVAALLARTEEVIDVAPLLPSPDEASVEDPKAPGRQLVAEVATPLPRPAKNACSVYPDDCERAPIIPILNLDGSVPQADRPSMHLDIPPALTAETRRGPPAEGVGPAIGVVTRLDRPPQAG